MTGVHCQLGISQHLYQPVNLTRKAFYSNLQSLLVHVNWSSGVRLLASIS